MYHTFATSTPTSSCNEGEGVRSSRPNAGPRRISTTNACIECRRRKIRCDGKQPCGQCLWYQHPEICAYTKPTQRVVPSKKLVEKLQSQNDQYRSILSRLFPGKEPDEFLSIDSEGSIDLAITLPASNCSPNDSADNIHSIRGKSEGSDSLEELERVANQDSELEEAMRTKDGPQSTSNDVNGISMAVDQAFSYAGISSINAAIKVILKTAPVARPFILQAAEESGKHSSKIQTALRLNSDIDPNYLPPFEFGQGLIDSYFAHVHVLMPMIDEENFRQTYLQGHRRDSPWLALLNMVFALGSLASSTVDNDDHLLFSQRAQMHLITESFGSRNLFFPQALGLFGGYYLPWLNRFDEAHAFMGATLRMATAHGLHKEYGDGSQATKLSCTASHIPVEIRRRTWWSLYCLDTWASITTGRPSLGRTGPGITVRTPQIPEQVKDTEASLRLLPIIHNVGFCKIATKVQDALASKSVIGFEELFALDAELERWHEELPPILKTLPDVRFKDRNDSTSPRSNGVSPRRPIPGRSRNRNEKSNCSRSPRSNGSTTCPKELVTPRIIMHWRYQNLRILMNRPWLLATALRRTPFVDLSVDERIAVSRCRMIASQTITDIEATCEESLPAAWTAVWMMYQAVMVPLVSLFSVLAMRPAPQIRASATPNRENEVTVPQGDDDVECWRRDILKSIAFFERMQPWSMTAKKSRDVVQRLFDATKYVGEYYAFLHQQQRKKSIHSPGLSQRSMTAAEQRTSDHSSDVSSPSLEALNAVDIPMMPMTVELDGQDFWDAMMWDTTAQFTEGAAQLDWDQQNVAVMPGTQEWSQWPMSYPNMHQQ